jgi:hypothetical protein
MYSDNSLSLLSYVYQFSNEISEVLVRRKILIAKEYMMIILWY